MPSSPYDQLPNLTGESGALEDIRSGGDPSRFFPAARGGDVDAVTGRILNVPRAGVYFDTFVPGGGTTSGVTQSISWDGVAYDTDGMYSQRAAFPARLYVRTPGLYLWTAQMAWVINGFGDRDMYFLKNGVFAFGTHYVPATSGAVPQFQFLSCPQPMNAGDFVEVRILQNSSVNLAVYGSNGNNGFQATLLSTFGSDNQ